MIYIGESGVVREVQHPICGMNGVPRLLYDGWCGVDGMARQFLWGLIQPEHVEKITIGEDNARIYVTTFDGDSNILSISLAGGPSQDELAELEEYGSVSIDPAAREITVVCTKAGYAIEVDLNFAVTLKTGECLPLNAGSGSPVKWYANLFQDMSFRGAYYMGGSGNFEGLYDVTYGERLFDGRYSGSASGENTVAVQDTAHIIVTSGLEYGRSHTTRMTMKEITIGGTAFLPEVLVEM